MHKDAIIKLAETFAQHHGLKLSTVSTYAANDGKWVDGLRGEASCTLRKAAAVTQWFSDRWPPDLEWPRDIPRPPKSKPEAA